MATRPELLDLARHHREEAKEVRRLRLALFGDSSSEAFSTNEASNPLIRTDEVALDAHERIILFLREVFSQHSELYWRGTPSGVTDSATSRILIESALAPLDRSSTLTLPSLEVVPGPVAYQNQSVGSLKHWGFDGHKTFSDLAAGTLQVTCKAQSGGALHTLAAFVAKAIKSHRWELCRRGFVDIGDVSIGGASTANPLYSQASKSERNAVVPVVISYLWQWTTRTSPRPSAHKRADLILGGFCDPGSHGVDSRPDSNEVTADAAVPLVFGLPDDD